MSRKLLSFLGAIPYQDALYYFPEQPRLPEQQPTAYVQQALLKYGLPDWQPEQDEVLIFTTRKAQTHNYHHRIQFFDRAAGKPAFYKDPAGLQVALEELAKEGRLRPEGEGYRTIPIPNGDTEAEIWEVFQQVYRELEEGDEVYLDITYGFRTLPMFTLLLLNYARTLKHIRIRAIYYGNYEAGRAARTDPEQPVEAPVFNLLPFAELQEWTYAARTFLELGNAEPLASLADDPNANLSRELLKFSKAILTCRGSALVQDIDIDLLKRIVSLNPSDFDLEEQLQPLLENIERKISPFQTKQLHNGFAAVDWCIQHGMIQQGITFLQETLISKVVEEIAGQEHLNEYPFRFAANGALNGFKNPKKSVQEKNKYELPLTDADMEHTYQAMYQWVKSRKGLSRLYKKLTGHDGFRNDIAHCGFRPNYKSPERLKEELIDLYQSIKALNL